MEQHHLYRYELVIKLACSTRWSSNRSKRAYYRLCSATTANLFRTIGKVGGGWFVVLTIPTDHILAYPVQIVTPNKKQLSGAEHRRTMLLELIRVSNNIGR